MDPPPSLVFLGDQQSLESSLHDIHPAWHLKKPTQPLPHPRRPLIGQADDGEHPVCRETRERDDVHLPPAIMAAWMLHEEVLLLRQTWEALGDYGPGGLHDPNRTDGLQYPNSSSSSDSVGTSEARVQSPSGAQVRRSSWSSHPITASRTFGSWSSHPITASRTFGMGPRHRWRRIGEGASASRQLDPKY